MALAVFSVSCAFGQTATTTALTAQSSKQSCPASGLTLTLTTLTINVGSSSGAPAGTVNIEDVTSPTSSPVTIASAALNASGQAIVSLYLANGSHSLQAVYAGNSTYAPSTSMSASATIASQCTSAFAVSLSDIAPATSGAMTLMPGQSGTATVTITPAQGYVDSLSTSGAPAFVTVSCSGLPSQSNCTFTPEKLEILPTQDAGIISTLVLQTTSQTVRAVPPVPLGHRSSPIAWAILLPGMLGLGGLAWGARKRRWLRRLSLVLLVGIVTTLGTTGCNPFYYYYHNGPSNPLQTPDGTFNITITGQSSNGVTAITNSTTLVMNVQQPQ